MMRTLLPRPSAALFVVTFALSLGCRREEFPFRQDDWDATCDVVPRPFTVSFAGNDHADIRGTERSYLAEVELPLDDLEDSAYTGLTDLYLMQIRVDTEGSAQTEWMQRAPMPEEFAEYWELNLLDIRMVSMKQRVYEKQDVLGGYWQHTESTMTGTCSWGEAQGSFSMVHDELSCGTANAGTSAGLGIFAGLLAMRRRRAMARA